MDSQRVADREQIRDCLARVARGEDRRARAVLETCYWPEAKLDFGIFAGSLEEYLGWVVPGSPAVLLTLHTLGQSYIEVHGARAAVETHITSYHRIDMGAEHRDVVIFGRYLDQMEKRGDEWRINKRSMLYDWTKDFGTSVDWSNGLMGAPFLKEGATGTTQGDASEAFFSEARALPAD